MPLGFTGRPASNHSLTAMVGEMAGLAEPTKGWHAPACTRLGAAINMIRDRYPRAGGRQVDRPRHNIGTLTR
jgi:hypothetical protein